MRKIYVTRPFLPPLEELKPFLEQIWESRILTNNGPYHEEFEKKLAEFLGVKYISLFNNGTLALITALKALNIKGEVITSPYSFVATTHALWWNNIIPVFADIDKNNFNLDPVGIKNAITKNTSAILPVHVYGYPCDVENIKKIADKYGLKVIYDAAHAFNVEKQNNSILNSGDLSILSFHATKVFNTFEGGAIISQSAEMKHHIDNLKNFGFRGETNVEEPGINAKMNEIQSALGILQLKYIDKIIEKRKVIFKAYINLLAENKGIIIPVKEADFKRNYAYFPIILEEEKYGESRDWLYEKLKTYGYYSRRYFYPLISNFNSYKHLPSASPEYLPVANKTAQSVLCLPIYPELDLEDVKTISKVINKKA